MAQSRLFVSSVSRRHVSRRRPGPPRIPGGLVFALVLLVVGVLAFAAGHGGL
jgi:hypothetical protein